DLTTIRQRATAAVAGLPARTRCLTEPEPLSAEISPALRQLRAELSGDRIPA
ncbi:MAG: hypothetical protein HC838_06010, partial [Spirulinaceae cyanobacterium RM2_2_10]|nr:hypothetical protein [Spirulinaceae cyanobacterium RM2_2_10]